MGQDEASKTPQEAAPSLDLAFDFVKNVLRDQRDEAQFLDSKVSHLFGIATVILGVGISAGVVASQQADQKAHLASFVAGGLAIVSYLFAIAFSFDAWVLHSHETPDNSIIMREWYRSMKPAQFKAE